MPHPGSCRLKQRTAQPRTDGELTHEQEKRQDREGITRCPAEGPGVQKAEERRPSRKRRKSEAADRKHGDRDRHPKRDQHKADTKQEPVKLNIGHCPSARSRKKNPQTQTVASSTAPGSAEK